MIGWLSFAATVAGICGGVAHGRLAQTFYWRRRLKPLILLLIMGALLCSLWFTLSFKSIFSENALIPSNNASVAIAITLFGWFVGSGLPIALELGVELTYPLPESVSCGVMTTLYNCVSVIYLFAAPYLNGPALNAGMLLTVLIAALLLPLVAERYGRTAAEERAWGLLQAEAHLQANPDSVSLDEKLLDVAVTTSSDSSADQAPSPRSFAYRNDTNNTTIQRIYEDE